MNYASTDLLSHQVSTRDIDESSTLTYYSLKLRKQALQMGPYGSFFVSVLFTCDSSFVESNLFC